MLIQSAEDRVGIFLKGFGPRHPSNVSPATFITNGERLKGCSIARIA